jgi:hypothetical protein
VPIGAECSGPMIPRDGRSVFVSVQHPGETTGSTRDTPDEHLARPAAGAAVPAARAWWWSPARTAVGSAADEGHPPRRSSADPPLPASSGWCPGRAGPLQCGRRRRTPCRGPAPSRTSGRRGPAATPDA